MRIVSIILKISITAALVFWLIKSGKIDFNYLEASIHAPFQILACLGIFILMALVSCLRDSFILNSITDQKIKYKTLLNIEWIGYFFSSILPGSVAGDFFKIYLLKKKHENFETLKIAVATLLNRIVGLMSLFLITGVFSSLSFSHPVHYFNIAAALGTILFCIFCYMPKNFTIKLTRLFEGKNNFVAKTAHYILTICFQHLRGILPNVIILSISCHALSVVAFMILANIISPGAVSSMLAFSVIPLGFASMAIPLAPGGLGIGHLAFEELFKLFSVSNGANFFNLYYIWWTLFCLTGVIPLLILMMKSGFKFRK